MSSKDLIDLDDRALVKNILEKLKNLNTKIRMWQKLTSIHKVNYAQLDRIDFSENVVTLKPLKGSRFMLAPTPIIYLHSDHRTTLFKTTIELRNPFRLEIKVPRFVKIQEGRSESRKPLADLYKAEIMLEGISQELGVKVLDLSQSGAGLRVPKSFFNLCQIGSVLCISTKDIPGLNGQYGIIRNKIPYCPNPSRPQLVLYRVGIEFIKETNLDDLIGS